MRLELITKRRVLLDGKLQNVHAVDRAEFDVADAVPFQYGDLFGGILRDFVGEGGKANHRWSSRVKRVEPGLRVIDLSSSRENRQALASGRAVVYDS